MREFHDMHKGRINSKTDNRSTALWDRHLLLERRQQGLVETRRYILDLASSASSRGS
jgi:hypothetical protein